MPTPSTPASSMRSAVSTAVPASPCIGMRTSAKANLGYRFGRRLASEGEEVDDVGPPAVNRVRFSSAAVHGLHISEQQRLGETLPKDRHNVADALVFQ